MASWGLMNLWTVKSMQDRIKGTWQPAHLAFPLTYSLIALNTLHTGFWKTEKGLSFFLFYHLLDLKEHLLCFYLQLFWLLCWPARLDINNCNKYRERIGQSSVSRMLLCLDILGKWSPFVLAKPLTGGKKYYEIFRFSILDILGQRKKDVASLSINPEWQRGWHLSCCLQFLSFPFSLNTTVSGRDLLVCYEKPCGIVVKNFV